MKILVLANNVGGLLNFRQEVVKALVSRGDSVTVSLPSTDRIEEVRALGAQVVINPVERRSTNPLKDLKLLFSYLRTISSNKPDIVLTYTIKPNIYGEIASMIKRIPYIANITGLGSAVEKPGILQKVSVFLYKIAMKKASCIFFQNRGNQNFFIENKINIPSHRLIPGSGINLYKFTYKNYPKEGKIKFIFISRIMREKGIDEYLAAAEYFTSLRKDLEFGILGKCEENYLKKLQNFQEKGIINYYGLQKDVRPYVSDAACLIHPTFYPEGMSNVILEAAASGRPVITTQRYGCMEAVDDGATGYLFPEKDTESLYNCIQKFLDLSIHEREEMGKNGRAKMEKEFNRQIVIDAYLEEINKAVN